ncbi:nucleotide-diphospho-sugar transferase [Cunninghamella echinulata]|nr:nucleotide-diphospho-sugar transferase [Cunninghamella echinulata]
MAIRRKNFGLQVVVALSIIMTIVYFLVPIPSPTNTPLTTADTTTTAIEKQSVKAAFVILARNSDLDGVRQSVRQMEDRFNRKFNYPYVFLNDDDFDEEFKELTTSLTKAKTFYGKIDESQWSFPSFIDQERAKQTRIKMAEQGIIYGDSVSYRHMCRYQSGFFFRHPLLDEYEYYWRIEPDINYYCDVDYDVFQMMKDNDYQYGWTMSLTEYRETIPTLWETTQEFMKLHPEYIVEGKDSLKPFLTDNNFQNYNGCHFWSNFEIGSLEFLRSKKYMDYFEYLDQAGGFFYERWGDAPVHSIAVALMLRKDQVHFFNDIGYFHNPLTHCPTERYLHKNCHCNADTNFDWQGWSCASRYKKVDPNFIWDEETYKNKTSPYRI